MMTADNEESNFLAQATYGASESAAARKISPNAEELRRIGYTLVPEILAEPQLSKARDLLEEVAVAEEAIMRNANVNFELDANTVRCPLAYDPFFVELAGLLPIREIVAETLGPYFVLLMQNGILNKGDTQHHQSRWHRDLNYQHLTSSQPLAVNFLVLLDDFTEQNGATWVLPASHLQESFPSRAYVEKFQVQLLAPAGTVIILDSMLFHRAGTNRDRGNNRRAVNHVVGRPFLAQQIDIPRFIYEVRETSYADDGFLSAYLGYRWNPAASAVSWRMQRANPTKYEIDSEE